MATDRINGDPNHESPANAAFFEHIVYSPPLFFSSRLLNMQNAFFQLFRCKLAFTGLFALSIAGTAVQSLADLTDQANRLEEVVVSVTRSELQRSQVAGSPGLLDSDTLARINHTHINEAMQRIAGVWISRGNGQEHLTAIRSPVLTGAGGCGAFLMAQDGIPLRASGFCNVNELFEAGSEHAGTIEVIKGPGTAAYGSNAMHGMINVLSPAITPGQRLTLEAGPDSYLRSRYFVGTDQIRLDLSGTTDGGYKDASGFDQQKTAFQHRGDVAGAVVTSRIAYTNLNQETAGFVQGPQAYKDPVLKNANPNPEAFRDARAVKAHSRVVLERGDATVQVTPYYRFSNMTFIQHFLPGQALEKNYHRSLGLQSTWTQQISDDTSWTLGADLETTKGHLTEFQPGVITTSGFLASIIPQGLHYNYDVDSTSSGLFAQLNHNLSRQWTLSAGLRWERSKYQYNNLMLDGNTKDDGTPCPNTCRFNRPADQDNSFSDLSPKLGLIYTLDPGQQLYLQLARGFRAPQTTELYRLQGAQAVSLINSEQLDSVEAGYRLSRTNLQLELAVFSMTKDNFIFRDTNRVNVDNGETSHRGLEFTLAIQPTRSLTASFSGTIARHRYENNPALSATPLAGNDIDTAPRQMGTAQLSWQLNSAWLAELDWTHLGAYYTDPQNLHEYKGHDLLHLRVQTKIGQWQVNTRLMNLLNTEYAERADFGFGQDRYFTGTPRALYLGVSRDF